ncbi:hypothetical protein EYC84_009530 [Monilinia fructicola]|uniref:Uncharacterized protein n=1 Tax=Monilinia fructicola TaxID=38448 RepID=A0A5M9JCR0_MONFR|nr:hypothetical protein EYC84_009530 [Monilinia fructicola]
MVSSRNKKWWSICCRKLTTMRDERNLYGQNKASSRDRWDFERREKVWESQRPFKSKILSSSCPDQGSTGKLPINGHASNDCGGGDGGVDGGVDGDGEGEGEGDGWPWQWWMIIRGVKDWMIWTGLHKEKAWQAW